MKRRRVVVAGLCAAVVAAGVAAMTATIGGATASHLTQITGGTASERALLRDVVAGMQPTAIEKIDIDDSGSDVALHFAAPPDRWNRAGWQEGLVAGAFRDRETAAGDDLNVLIFGGDANGATLNRHGPATPPPPARPGDAAAARQLFENAAAKAGVSFDELAIHQPDGIAVVATFESDDPAAFLVHRMQPFLAALGDHSSLDGTYISLVDAGGRTVWETSWDGRISEGSVGSSPDLEGCSPVSNWSGVTPPPCPAK
jgi:hypothetical protein